MTREDDTFDSKLAMALAHPSRVRILELLTERDASPAQLAKRLDLPLGTVSYHTKILLDTDCISLIRTEAHRGALEHFYRAKPRTTLGSREWQKVPKALRGDIIAMALDSFCNSVIQALEREAFRRNGDARLVWETYVVDQEGWETIVAILEDAEAKVRTLAHECEERLEDPAGAISALVSFSAFEVERSKEDRE